MCAYPFGDVQNPTANKCQGPVDDGVYWAPGSSGLGSPQPKVDFTESSRSASGPPHWRWYDSPDTSVRLYSDDTDSTHTAVNWYELFHPDGTVARFEKMPYVPAWGAYWRIAWVRDPFDNQITFTYTHDSQDPRRLEKLEITYPNGVVETWDYAPSWGLPTGFKGVEIRFSNVALNGAQVADLTGGLIFKTGSPDDEPFGLAELYRVFYPKLPSLAAPAANSLYSVPASGHGSAEYRVYEFEYGSQFDDRLTKITMHRAASITAGTLTGGDVQMELDWVQGSDGYWRVSKQRGADPTEEYEFLYALDSTQSYVQTLTVTDPRGTKTTYTQDAHGRPTKIEIDPPNTATESPRQFDAYSTAKPELHEPDKIEWNLIYDASCTCSKVKEVTSPSGRKTKYEWNPTTGRLKKKTVPNPSTEASPAEVDYRIDWTADGRWPLTITTPYMTWTAKYLWAPRLGANHGQKPTSVTWKSSNITVEGGTDCLASAQFWDAAGRVAQVVSPTECRSATRTSPPPAPAPAA